MRYRRIIAWRRHLQVDWIAEGKLLSENNAAATEGRCCEQTTRLGSLATCSTHPRSGRAARAIKGRRSEWRWFSDAALCGANDLWPCMRRTDVASAPECMRQVVKSQECRLHEFKSILYTHSNKPLDGWRNWEKWKCKQRTPAAMKHLTDADDD